MNAGRAGGVRTAWVSALSDRRRAKERFVEYTWKEEGGAKNLYGAGQLIGTLVPFADDDVESRDEITTLEAGVFRCTRRFALRPGRPRRSVRLTLDFVAPYRATYAMIPAVSYNGNHWGSGNDPKGFIRDGVPWSFAYHRTAVPGATYSESSRWSVALFGLSPAGGVGLACSLIPEADRTVHRLIWPEEEQPLVYARRDEYTPGYAETLTLEPGETFEATAYVVAEPIGRPRMAYRKLLDAAWKLSVQPQRTWFSPSELWQMGVEFVTGPAWAEEGIFRGFSVGLLPAGTGWKQRQYYKYEIGWAGQNASLACALLWDYLKHGREASREKGLATLDTWAAHARLRNGLFRCVFDPILGAERREVYDACNLGNAAEGFFEAHELARQCGLDRPAYRDTGLAICDFLLTQQRPDGQLGKAWAPDGTCLDPHGTIGCYLIPAFVAAYRATQEPKYLAAAEKSYEFYIGGLRHDGYTTAGALDTHCVDKESAYPLIDAALALYDLTGKRSYIEAAEDASYYFASWQWHQTLRFPPDSPLGAMECDTFGGTAVSTQHHHLDPWGVRLPPAWFRLADLTGNPLWRQRAVAAWKNGMMGVSDGNLVVQGMRFPRGTQGEGYFHTRWHERGDVSLWLVVWPAAFRLETLRRLGDWSELEG